MFASDTLHHLEIISLDPFHHVSSFPRARDLFILIRSFSKYVLRRLFAPSLISPDCCTDIITPHAQTSPSRSARRHGASAIIKSLQCPCQFGMCFTHRPSHCKATTRTLRDGMAHMIEVDDQEALSGDGNDEEEEEEKTEDVVKKTSESDTHSCSEKSQ